MPVSPGFFCGRVASSHIVPSRSLGTHDHSLSYPSGPTRLSGHQSSVSGGGRVVFGKVPASWTGGGDGGASVFNLASAVHAGYPPIVLEDRPLSLGEAMDLPWHTSGRIYDHGRVRGDVVTVCFQRVRGVQLNNPLQLPRIRALLERGGRSIAQNAREERWSHHGGGERRLCAWGCTHAWAREAGSAFSIPPSSYGFWAILSRTQWIADGSFPYAF